MKMNRKHVFALSLVGALFALPFILFSMAGGFLADRFSKRSVAIGTKVRTAEDSGLEPAVVCAPGLRPALRGFLVRLLPHVPVLSYDELADHVTIDDLGMVSIDASAAI